uniref:L1 transposable element RRM domain-containing protein n=1 Tax=Neolamprologus brichardi TaxID=32507 RepID=A0A3Q4GJ23_NEOBR
MSGGAKTRSHTKRAAHQEHKEMDNSYQQRDSESVSAMLKDIKMELQTFRSESKQDMLKMREELRQDVRAELASLKAEVYQSISANTEKANSLERKLIEAETRIAEAETLNAAMKDALTKVMESYKSIQRKMTDLEGRTRRNNIRLYGLPEGAEGDSIPQFVEDLRKKALSLPHDISLRIQRAHRALTGKPGQNAPARSIILNFQEYIRKEDILKRAWAGKVVYKGQHILFDHDYATEVAQKRWEYGSIKRASKEQGVRFQTPLDKIRIHWDMGVRTYGSAREAAFERNIRY